jgi:predicted RNA-binding protein Jag
MNGEIFKTRKDLKMFEKPKNNKGGRPPKEVKRLRTLSVKCSFFEGMQIENKAKQVGLSVSEYLREMGLKGTVKVRVRTLPREVLHFAGTLNHIAANLNQIAKKRNSFDELSVLERAKLNQQSASLQQIVTDIKGYLQ